MTYNTLITAGTLFQNIDQPNWVIIDCRFSLADTEAGGKAFLKGHIPNAFYAHLDKDLSSRVIPGKTGRHPLPDIDVLADKFSMWGIDSSSQVVVYDDKGGAIASRLWWLLNWLGHENVAVLDGGWQFWEKEKLPVSNQVSKSSRKKFIPKKQAHFTVSRREMGIQTEKTPPVIIDSRAHERYLGRIEPIDPIAGHIPGAINLPFMENLDAEGKFLSKEALQSRFLSIKAGNNPPVFYCGSGVTACHNILAFKYAGYGQAILYPGSWSEWITAF